MEYEKAVQNLLNTPRYKKKADCKGIARLLGLLGRPHENFYIIHVAGTNGKGSVCEYLSRIGQHLGYAMGMFTSPHLTDIRERFQINNNLMGKEQFIKYYKKVKEAEQALREEGGLPATFFELVFAMAMCYFSDSGVDYAIVEAGIGGKSDTTNVVNPILSIITAIGLDHMALLGDTLEAIAIEKAGIMRKGVPVVASRQYGGVRDILCQSAVNIGAICHFTDEFDIQILKNNPKGIDFSIDSGYDSKSLFHTNMCGIYQAENAATAIMASVVLWKAGISQLKEPVAKSFWPARMEQIYEGFYVDGAHNLQAVEAFCMTLEKSFGDSGRIFLYAVANDKDDETMVAELLRMRPKAFVITRINGERATDEKQVLECIKRAGKKYGLVLPDVIIDEPNIARAVDLAKEQQESKDIIFAVGSLYLAAAIKDMNV